MLNLNGGQITSKSSGYLTATFVIFISEFGQPFCRHHWRKPTKSLKSLNLVSQVQICV